MTQPSAEIEVEFLKVVTNCSGIHLIVNRTLNATFIIQCEAFCFYATKSTNAMKYLLCFVLLY
jgi:hypothetical protein